MNNSSVKLSLCIIIFISGCGAGKNDSKLHFSNSIESTYAWADFPARNIIWSDKAHSGNYVCKIDSSFPYSVAFNMKLSDISKKNLKSVRISAWVNLSSMTSNPLLIMDIRDNTQKTLDYISKSAMEFVSAPNEWVQVSWEVGLDEKNRNKQDNFLRIFVANEKPDYSLVDDIELQFTEK